VPTREWSLDPAYVADVAERRAILPDLPVICSDMRRAVETARFLGEPTVDARLTEVSRPWTDDLHAAVTRYLFGEPLQDWEPQVVARARFSKVVEEYGRVIYLSHGTVLSLYLASVMPTLSAMTFWAELSSPNVWQVEGEQLVHLCAARH